MNQSLVSVYESQERFYIIPPPTSDPFFFFFLSRTEDKIHSVLTNAFSLLYHS